MREAHPAPATNLLVNENADSEGILGRRFCFCESVWTSFGPGPESENNIPPATKSPIRCRIFPPLLAVAKTTMAEPVKHYGKWRIRWTDEKLSKN
jgi:hypothetical protein